MSLRSVDTHPLVVLGLLLTTGTVLALVALALVVRRAVITGLRTAESILESQRRAAAAIEEARDDLDHLRAETGRLTAAARTAALRGPKNRP